MVRGSGKSVLAPIIIGSLLLFGLVLVFAQRRRDLSRQVRPRRVSLSRSINVGAGKDLQAAINSAQYGDTIVLEAGAVYETRQGFSFPNKGPGTGTDADYITIRTSNLAGIPLEGVRVSPANAGATAKIVANKVPTAVNIATNAHHYRFLGISFTNRANTGVHTHSLVAGPFYNPIGSHPHHIEFDRCLFYPIEEIDDPNGIARSVSRGVYINGAEITVKNSYLWGFTGRYKYGSTEIIDSECILTDGGPGPFHIINNFLEAWYNNIFTGGAGLSTANVATVQSGATLTSATLSQSANLNVGDYITFKQPSGPNANAKVLTKGDNSITFTSLHRYGGGAVAPAAGSTAGWNGPTISNVEIRRNTFNKRPEWATAGIGSPKGYMEIKTADGLIIDGNIFQGSTSTIAITSRNQGGSAPWMTVKNVTITNNKMLGYGTITLLMQDGYHLNQPGGNVTVANNLFMSSKDPNRPVFIYLAGGYNVQIYHNTILSNSNSIIVSDLATTGVVFRDNITGSGVYGMACTLDGQLNTCWPSLVMNKNVIIDIRNGGAGDQHWKFPGTNYWVKLNNIADVKFMSFAKGDYRLAADSPYRNAATDGKDIGVDMDALDKSLASEVSVPTGTDHSKK